VELRYAHLQTDPIFLEYEYVGDGDLAQLAAELHRENKATPHYVSRLVLELARAVGFAHGQHPPIVHRDLKPANVLIQRLDNGKIQLKVADFGIGGVASERGLEQARETARESATTAREYTPLYASPQQRKGLPPDPRDDVYALGVIWYQLLVGDCFTEAPRGEGWKKRLAGQGMGEQSIGLLEKCLEDEACDRPPHAGALAEELTELVKRPQRPVHLVSPADEVLDAIPVGEPRPSRPQRALSPALHWSWIVTACFPWLNWIFWIYSGVKTRCSLYFGFALVYAVPFVLLCVVSSTMDYRKGTGEIPNWVNVVAAIPWVIGIVHFMMTRKSIEAQLATGA
jgi:serine/threonine protein kinase